MCTVDKMLIKGIRSFSPENQTAIEFYKPLTLIVGANGAGKTTVIECLKQACTGELPPNTRSGQSFIHDPKVANETEVKAQIKLRFNTSTGQPVVVSRSFQLTQKKTTMQFKTLDSTVMTLNKTTGEKQTITYRCADIDKMVPTLMGVSKAVLENVIFVHQEESNWPLAEGRILKDKFDDIFSATKYTKALEALRKLRTEKVGEVKLMRVQLDHLKTHRDQAQKLKKEVAEGQARVGAFEAQIAELESQIKAKQDAVTALEQRISTILDLCQGSEALTARHDLLVRQTQEYLHKLKDGDLEETDAELEQWLASYEHQCNDAKFQLEEVIRTLNTTRIEKESMSDKYQRDCLAHGRMAAEASAHDSHCSELQRFMGHAAAVLGLPAPPTSPSMAGKALLDAASSFRNSLQAKKQALEAQVQEIKAMNRSKDVSMTEEIDRISTAISRNTETMRLKREQSTKNERAMQNLESEISLLVVNMELVNDAHVRVAELEGRLRAKQRDVGRSGHEEEAARERAAIEQIQARISALRQEREQLTFLSDSTVKLRLRRQELINKEEAMAAFLTRWRPKLLTLLGTTELPPTGRLRDEAERALAGRKSELAAKGKELAAAQAAQAVAQGSLGSSRSQLYRLEAELNQLRGQLRSAMQQAVEGSLEEALYDLKLQEIKTTCEGLGDRVANARGLLTVLQHHHSEIQAGKDCPTCKRHFVSQQERQQVLQVVESEIEELPSKVAQQAADLEHNKRQLEALQALQPQRAKMADLQREVPALRLRVESDEVKVSELAMKVSELVDEHGAMEHDVQDLAKVMSEAAWQIDRQWREVEEMRRQVGQMEGMLGSQAAGRSVADVDNQLEAEERDRAVHERLRDEAVRAQAKLKDELLLLTTDFTSAKAECARIGESFVKRTDMEAKVQELAQQNTELAAQVSQLQAEQQPRAAQREALVQERAAARAQAQLREEEAEARLREGQQLLDQMQAKLRPVEEYEAKGRAAELQRVNKGLEELKRRMEANQQAIQELESQKNEGQRKHAEMDVIRRDALDVLEYRRSRAAMEAVAQEVKQLEHQVAQLGDQAALSRQREALQGERHELQRRQYMLRGQVTSTQQALQKAQKDLQAPEFALIEAKFNEMRLRLKTTEYANEDLDKYHKALEKALLTYHTTKMSDINKMIKELWQKTYRGQDIDYIQVKADAEGTGARSYNYRVVMYSGGAELEMRGRCSAGQKVLACLIIRLALAETFCLNCGILALDEPTTNLDADNAASLAEALRAIMMARREQENFQLIVITHDEKFAHLIGTRENTDYMWRITKDVNQHTKIEMEAVG